MAPSNQNTDSGMHYCTSSAEGLRQKINEYIANNPLSSNERYYVDINRVFKTFQPLGLPAVGEEDEPCLIDLAKSIFGSGPGDEASFERLTAGVDMTTKPSTVASMPSRSLESRLTTPEPLKKLQEDPKAAPNGHRTRTQRRRAQRERKKGRYAHKVAMRSRQQGAAIDGPGTKEPGDDDDDDTEVESEPAEPASPPPQQQQQQQKQQDSRPIAAAREPRASVTCANCRAHGHELADCAWPSVDGLVHGCPFCNTADHEGECPAFRPPVALCDKLDWAVLRRGNKPPLAIFADWVRHVRLAVDRPDLGATIAFGTRFPWTRSRPSMLASISERPWELSHQTADLPADPQTGNLRFIKERYTRLSRPDLHPLQNKGSELMKGNNTTV